MSIEVGNVVEGVVTGITNFGAFVELPEGKTGLIHISEVAVYTPTGSQSVGTRIQDGFKRNLTSVKTAVVDLFVLVASTLPIWLPAILVFAAAAAGIRYYIGRNSSGEKGKKDTCASKKELGDIKEKS